MTEDVQRKPKRMWSTTIAPKSDSVFPSAPTSKRKAEQGKALANCSQNVRAWSRQIDAMLGLL